MPDAPNRRRFQVHLSTAIVLMLVTGGLIGANTYVRMVKAVGTIFSEFPEKSWELNNTEADFLRKNYGDRWEGFRYFHNGWPYPVKQWGNFGYVTRKGIFTLMEHDELPWRTVAMIKNLFVGLAILFATCFLSEWLIRRRAARNGS